jgi:hypothetical protein
MKGEAIISDCGTYRYRLERDGPGAGSTAIIMVNPSTADATKDDHTIRKLRGFGERYGWGRLIVGNLFAFRATDINELRGAWDPIGPENDKHLHMILEDADRVIVAWGPPSKLPKHLRRRWVSFVRAAEPMADLYSIGASAKDGHPCHPLTLPYARELQPWSLIP